MLSASKTAAPSTGGYSIQKSVRLRSSASAYLNRTFTTPTNNKIWTYSFWIKLGTIGTEKVVLGTSVSNTPFTKIYFDTNSNFTWYEYTGSNYVVTTTQVFRDPSSWYHVVLAVDTTQATASNRAKLYINGVQVTSFSSSSYVPQNTNTTVNSAVATYIGQPGNGGSYLDGYLTEINFIDGQQLTPTSFGAYNATTGVWQPIKYTGTYGTNGFYLNFSNNASTTTLGYDTSGNGNNWTTNNISLTAGSTYDSMTDVPTLTSATVANYCVLNPLDHIGSATYSSGNLQATSPTSGENANRGTMSFPATGSFYIEATVVTTTTGNNAVGFGCALDSTAVPSSGGANMWGFYFGSGGIYANGTTIITGLGAASAGTVLQFAINGTNAWVGKNNVWYDSSGGTTGNPSTGANPTFTLTKSVAPYFSVVGNGATQTLTANFGQQPWTYTPPTGFVALNTYNLPTPTIKNGAAYMAASLYTGTGYGASVPAGQTIVNSVNGVGFQPDFIWIKERSGTGYNIITDSVRGVTKNLYTNATSAEATNNGTDVTTFNSNGFSVGTDSNGDGVNRNGASVVGWQWQAGKGFTSSNTNGSITSTVSVNATAGFSVVTYTGNGTTGATIGHGLNAVPYMMITKRRSTTSDWGVYHQVLGNTNYLLLDTTAVSTAGSNVWNNTSPTSTVFTVGNASFTNTSTDTFVAYCFTQIAGYSKFGSYTGNSSSDGPFVYCGFRPRWIMIKRTDSTGSWLLIDTSRNPINIAPNYLLADLSSAEGTDNVFDVLSNGFKVRTTSASENASSGTYIYACFAENPFNYSLAR